jgi:hypothetical protein
MKQYIRKKYKHWYKDSQTMQHNKSRLRKGQTKYKQKMTATCDSEKSHYQSTEGIGHKLHTGNSFSLPDSLDDLHKKLSNFFRAVTQNHNEKMMWHCQ